MRRIGLLGGTFNPPHVGHLKLAEIALRALALDEVRFIPAAQPPHKPQPAGPGPEERLRLLEIALAASGLPFRAEGLEVARGGTSYTVDTLAALAAREPGNAWIFLMGSDQLNGFAKWRQPERILALAALAVTPRPGHPLQQPDGLLAGRERATWSGAPGELIWLPGTELEVASTGLRAELGRGNAPDAIPPQVLTVLLRENQYR